MSKRHPTPARSQRRCVEAPRDQGRASRDDDRFTVGSEAMAKLNAVEGIKQSPESRTMFAEFERSDASDEERRRAIIARHARKG